MPINRRRAASSQISSNKKVEGHRNEEHFANLISGEVIHGTQKGDVRDTAGNLYSVKGGKKWQIFLYGYDRISGSKHLKVLQNCLEAFPEDPRKYFRDRVEVIEFKEEFIRKNGRDRAKLLSNQEIETKFPRNEYIASKNRLNIATQSVYEDLLKMEFRHNFLNEAIFNMNEVDFLAIKDTTFEIDNLFKVFSRKDVLEIFTSKLMPSTSSAGLVPEDFNVAGQKTLLVYETRPETTKNIVEIEIRNDSETHYRQVRFNMYSKDALVLLVGNSQESTAKRESNKVKHYGLN